MSQYILLLVVVPVLAYLSGKISELTGINFWAFFGPLLAVGFLVYQFGGKIFRKK